MKRMFSMLLLQKKVLTNLLWTRAFNCLFQGPFIMDDFRHYILYRQIHWYIHNNIRLQGKLRPHTGYLSSTKENEYRKHMTKEWSCVGETGLFRVLDPDISDLIFHPRIWIWILLVLIRKDVDLVPATLKYAKIKERVFLRF